MGANEPPIESAYFDGYAVAEPSGDWEYELDDFGVRYGPGEWPFWQQHEGKLIPCSVRLAPNSAYQAWGTQCVMIFAVLELSVIYPGRASVEVSMRTLVQAQGMGGWLYDLDAHVLLDTFEWRWCVPPPRMLIERAEARRDKLLRFLRQAIAERDAGQAAPVTAYERWSALKKQEKSAR